MSNLLLKQNFGYYFEMAGEFTKRTVNDENVWTCVLCNVDIVNQAKPRGHVCQPAPPPTSPTTSTSTPGPRPTGSQSVPSSPFNHQYGAAFAAPPPGFNMPPPNHQNQADMNALLQFQMLQAEQQKQMMVLMQQQNQEMMRAQQEQRRR